MIKQPSGSNSSSIFICSILAVISFGCSGEKPQPKATSAPAGAIASIPKTTPSAAKVPIRQNLPSNTIDTYQLALDKAASAASLSQAAQSTEDWKLVTNRWQDAIKLLKAVPASSPNRKLANTKLAEYQKNLTRSQQKTIPIPLKPQPTFVTAPKPEPTLVTAPTPQPTIASAPIPQPRPQFKPTRRVFRAPIIGRLGGTPVIEVTFNGRQKFPMILDTGASGIVITERMAASLGVVPVGKILAQTPSQKAVEFPVGIVDSVAVGGAVVTDMPVAIASQLEVGLLGQDFFRNYDVTIRSDAIEFHVR
jgi:gag-polyprotein putative aspartyl protease